MTKEVLFGKQSRDKLLIGIQKVAKVVGASMGANGKCILIGEAAYNRDGVLVQLPTKISKDGFTIAKHFSLQDPIEQRGAMLILEAATKTVEQAGDSTTCCCVLSEALITGGVKLIEEGGNSQQIKKGMDNALAYVIDELKKMSIPVRGNNDMIRQIATISANNDTEIGGLIADAYKKIGDDGVIDIEASQTGKTDIKTYDGYKFEKGWVSPFFVNNPAKEICELENPYILLYEKRIIHHDQFTNILSQLPKGNPVLIICEDSEQEGLAVLISNKMQGYLNICVVKAPDFGQMRGDSMEDIALLTGGMYISDSKGVGIKEVKVSHLGQAKKVIVSSKETIIIGGASDEKKLASFVSELKATINADKTEEENSRIEKRIARLTGGFAVIEVGAATETELSEKLDRVDDAVRATKAAIAEGALPGGGTAFLRVNPPIVAGLNPANSGFNDGIDLVFESLKKPFLQICENSGVDGQSVLKEVLSYEGNDGYNALSDEIVDMVEAGIIDATKALRCALTNAVSVAGMVLTSEASIITLH